MSALFITYLWHYLAARAIYDDLLRPLTRGQLGPLMAMAVIVSVAFGLGRLSVRKGRQ
jgi:hypothetical protein